MQEEKTKEEESRACVVEMAFSNPNHCSVIRSFGVFLCFFLWNLLVTSLLHSVCPAAEMYDFNRAQPKLMHYITKYTPPKNAYSFHSLKALRYQTVGDIIAFVFARVFSLGFSMLLDINISWVSTGTHIFPYVTGL